MYIPSKVKRAFMHAFYVAGLSFFSTLSTSFADSIISPNDLRFALTSAFIASGMAFFVSLSAQKHEEKKEETVAKGGKIKGHFNYPSFIAFDVIHGGLV